MARIVIKRKTYGVAEAASNTIGGVANGLGQALDSKPAAMVGGLGGALAMGGTLGGLATSGLASMGGLGAAMSGLGGPLGWLVGAGIGAAATRGLGRGLKEAAN